MKNTFFIVSAVILLTTSCQKTIDKAILTPQKPVNAVTQNESAGFVKYTIRQGQQYCDQNGLVKVEYDELKFAVKFDSSAVYSTIDPANQGDINKLYGFSDNNAQHHQFSARFGWRWGSEEGLCLYAYTYNDGVRASKLLGSVKIGAEHTCSIKVTKGSYIFTLNDRAVAMPRTSAPGQASGYRLYPYFGGDELAPHPINIWIKEF